MTELDSSEILSAPDSWAPVLADLANRAEQIHPLAQDVADLPPGLLLYDVPQGLGGGRRVEVLDLEKHLERPRAKTGQVQLVDPDSFNRYVHEHSVAGTTLWADVDAGRIVAVLDDHAADETPGIAASPGWGRHRATLTLRKTPEWQHWTSRDGQLAAQAQFAEHVEDGITAVVDPPPAELLEACRTLHVQREVTFRSADRPQSGEIRFNYEETDTARSGRAGDVELPERFALRLAPWRGCEPVIIEARLRYRLNQGTLTLGYRLTRPAEVLQAAFEQVLTTVQAGTGLAPLLGVPRTAMP